jgi:hypothetical protein
MAVPRATTAALLGAALAIALLAWMAMTLLTSGSRLTPGEVPAIRTVVGQPPAPAATAAPVAPVPGNTAPGNTAPGNTAPGSTSAPAPAQRPGEAPGQGTGTSPAEGYPGGSRCVQDPKNLASIKFCGGS